MTDANPAPKRRSKPSPEGIAEARLRWGPWIRTITAREEVVEAATQQAIAYVETGLSAEVVAALIRLRLNFKSTLTEDQNRVREEYAYCGRVRQDVAELLAADVITAEAAASIDLEFASRLRALGTWSENLMPVAAAAAPAVQPGQEAVIPTQAATAPPAAPAPAGPSFSLRDLFAEHSVLILASLGAFLLVVATVLFELYGTVGLGGGVRLGAVIVLNLIFAAAGYFALRYSHLRPVGQIYIALAAVLLPLVAVAAWSFLALGSRGITIDEALAVTGAACAFVYGGLAMRLGLRAYGEMAGVAILAAAFGASGAVGGPDWRSVGLALAPLVYGVWQRALRDRVFSDFQWFAHFSALAALGSAIAFEPSRWQWTITLATLAFSYLAWQALAQHSSRAWSGEAALVLAAAAAVGPLGVSSYHFLLPMLVGLPLLILARSSEELGIVGRLYRAHPGHLHLAVLLGFGLAAWENALGATWPAASALWFAGALYAADFFLGRTELTGYTLRAAVPLALVATGSARHFGPWTATLTAMATLAFVIPFVSGPSLQPLTRRASSFFYGTLALVVIELHGASIGVGYWEIPTALVLSTAAFGLASELGAVRLSAVTARGLFTLAWFAGVDSLGAQGWRGPFDALLAVVYTGLAQVRALTGHRVATAAHRWFVHATGAAALLLCFSGPADLFWWRFTAAFGLLAVAYWWITLARAKLETPWLAWGTLAMGGISLVVAAVSLAWQGSAVVAFALPLTVAWAAARRLLTRPNLEESGFAVLAATVLLGIIMSLRQEPPLWTQAAAMLLAAAVSLAWSLIPAEQSLRATRPTMRALAGTFTSTGVLIGVAVLRLDAAYAGLIALVLAAAHVEWNVRTKQELERWYAIGAVLVLAVVLFFWPYGQSLPALTSIEFVAFAALCLSAGVRRRQWYLAYPAGLLLVPALHLSVRALGLEQNVQLEEIWMAGLAWVIGLTGLVVRPSFGRRWALSAEAAAVTIALVSLAAMAAGGYADAAGIALLAYAPQTYTAAMQERERWVLPIAAAVASLGTVTLLGAHNADTILYAAALGVLGLLIWIAGRLAAIQLGRDPLVDMHRYLGLGLLGASGLAGFFFPDRTGPHSLGAVLAAVGLLVTGGVLWLDAQTFRYRPNVYVGLVAATAAGYFVAREISLPAWQLVPPGLGVVACGILLRDDRSFLVDKRIRRLIVAGGLGLVMGWAVVLTVTGDPWWLVTLLIEGAVTVGAGIVLRTRVLLGGGGASLALVSLRALLSVAQAGYLFAAFAAVALVLLVVATALALGRERYRAGTRGMREQLAQWD